MTRRADRDQADRLNDLHLALYDAACVFDALGRGDLDEGEALAIARLASQAIRRIAMPPGEAAVLYGGGQAGKDAP